MYKCLGCGRRYYKPVNFCDECGSFMDSSIFCDECEAVVSENDEICASCGALVNTHISTIVCDECGTTLPCDKEFCPDCGAPVGDTAVTVICEECGTSVVCNDVFCYNCGAPVSSDYVFPAEYSQPASKESHINKKSRTAYLIGNIIFIITLIPATVMFLSNIFVLDAVGIVERPFSFFGISDGFSYLNELFTKLENLGITSLEDAKNITGLLSYSWIIVVLFLVYITGQLISGVINVNSGKPLTKLCFMPTVYLVICYSFCIVADSLLLSPINDFIAESVNGLLKFQLSEYVNLEIGISLETNFIIMVCIICFNALVLSIIRNIEKHNSEK